MEVLAILDENRRSSAFAFKGEGKSPIFTNYRYMQLSASTTMFNTTRDLSLIPAILTGRPFYPLLGEAQLGQL
jgi:hypothetical protein